MYNVNTKIDSESRSANFLDVGIHEDVELKGIEYKTSPDAGNEFMVFHFEKDGKQLSHTEWKPKDVDPEKLENKTNNQIKRVKHIVTKFISEETYVFTATDFKSFCLNTIKLLGNSYVGKKVRIKVVYSFNNYTSLPNYVPFIEKMEVPKEQSKLEILSIDKMVKERADVEPAVQQNPFETKVEDLNTSTTVDAGQDENELPF
jgi:hypothetical protein